MNLFELSVFAPFWEIFRLRFAPLKMTPLQKGLLETALEMNRLGILAAGDVRRGSIKRVTSAVGEGSMTVKLVHEFLDRRAREAARSCGSPRWEALSVTVR